MDYMDKKALTASEVFTELEKIERRKVADFADKILQNPAMQKNIVDGITKKLTSPADDGGKVSLEKDFNKLIEKLDDDQLKTLLSCVQEECEERDIDLENEENDGGDDEEASDDDDVEEEMEVIIEASDLRMFKYATSELRDLACVAINDGDTESAYLIERAIGRITEEWRQNRFNK